MLRTTTTPLLAFVLVLALASPVAAAPDSTVSGGFVTTLLNSLDELWRSTMAAMTSSGGPELAAESLGGQEALPIAYGFPGYEPVGEDLNPNRADTPSSEEDGGTPNIWPDIEPVG